MSEKSADTIRLGKIENHPDPETIRLGIAKVHDYTIVLNKEQWKEGDLAVYITPDTLVPLANERFSFLRKENDNREYERIKVKRLRGVYSEGLLIPSPEGLNEGDNAWDLLGLIRYEGQANTIEYSTGGQWEECPLSIPFSKYDLENFRKYNHLLVKDEEVVITEKINGSNARYMFHNGRMYCGSRSGWRKQSDNDKENVWWAALKHNLWIEEFCQANPDLILFGEVYGHLPKFKYDAKDGEIKFRVFDIFDIENKCWIDNKDLLDYCYDLGLVPILYVGPFSKEKVLEHTDGKSTIPGSNNIREGCVIKPATERRDPRLGRVALKNVSNDFLLKD